MNDKALFDQFVAFTTAVHQVTYDLTKDVKADDITPVQYRILEYITVSQPVTLSQISECQHLSMPNASRELRKLTEKDLCEKFTADDDRRKQYFRLSERGQARMNEAFQQIESRFQQRIHGLTDTELQSIHTALDILHTKVFYTDDMK